MGLHLQAVAFEVRDAPGVGRFWAELLGREVVPEDDGALVPGNETQIGLRFVETETETETGPNRLHLHLTSTDLDDQMRTVSPVEDVGGRVIRKAPEAASVVRAAPDRNE